MAHVAKYTRGAVNGLTNHWERKTENHSNKEIDKERSHLNYDLCEKDGDTLSRLRERLNEVYCLNRKDVNVCADWVVTMPQEVTKQSAERQREFFESTYDFLEKRYGKKNVISANVHNDETTPHMHFAFVPVSYDVKKKRERVSAKIVVNRKDLQTFHDDLHEHLKHEIPHIYQDGIRNEKTIGVDTVDDLKKHSEEIQKLKEEMAADFKRFKEPKKVLDSVLENTEIKKASMFSKDEVAQMSPKDLGRMETLALSSMKIAEKFSSYQEQAEHRIKIQDRQISNMINLFNKEKQKNKHLRTQNNELDQENLILSNDNYNLKNNIVKFAEKHASEKYKEMENERNGLIETTDMLQERVVELFDENEELRESIKNKNESYELLAEDFLGVSNKLEVVKNERDEWKNKFEVLWDNTKHYLKHYIPDEMKTMVKSVKAWFKEDTGHDIEPEQKKTRQRGRDDGMSL